MRKSFAAAAPAATPKQLAEIREWAEAGRTATSTNDVVRAASAHRQSTWRSAPAGNPFLPPAVEPLRAQTELVFSLLVDRRGLIGWSEHEEILAAIESGDPESAARATRRHMDSVLHDLRQSAAPIR